MTRKTIGVVVQCRDLARVREALRAAVGLCLRGDAVRVYLDEQLLTGDPISDRALATLRQLGQAINEGEVRDCDAAEVWT